MRRLVLRLAIADALHDRALFLCAVLTIAAVMLPLLLLLGLKTGMVERLVADLRADPQAVLLRPTANVDRPPEWFEALRQRPDVRFVAPRNRFLGTPVQYARGDDPIRPRAADFEISGAGDPLLGPSGVLVGDGRVVVTRRVAEEAGLGPGDELLVWRPLPRSAAPGRQRAEHRVVVAAVVAAEDGGRRQIFGTADLAGRLEDGSEREGAPEAAGQRTFARFRLYARDIADVPALAQYLESLGVEVETRAGDITWVSRIDRNLTLLLLTLVGCAAVGFAGALWATLWGNVARKRRSLALLRLIGFPARRLALFPLVQAALVALVGSAVAAAAAVAAAMAMNAVFGTAYGMPQLVRVLPWHLAAAAGGALLLGLLAGAVAGRPVLGIVPAEGLREG